MSVAEINIQDVKELKNAGQLELIDVREVFEFEESHLKDAKLIPMSLVPVKMDEIDFSKKVVFYCRSGARSGMIANTISKQGKNVFNLRGGMMGIDGDDEMIVRQ